VAVPRLAFGKAFGFSRGVGGRERIRFRSCFHGALRTARSLGQGKPEARWANDAQTLGERGLGNKYEFLRRMRRRSRGCARTLYCLVAEVDKRLGPKKPFFHTHSPFRAVENAVNGGLAFG
jgi:hypothetical protein